MPEIIPGYITEQKVSIVQIDEINDQIQHMATAANWLVVSISISGSNVIILFQRNVPAK